MAVGSADYKISAWKTVTIRIKVEVKAHYEE